MIGDDRLIPFPTADDVEVEGKRVLLRVDYNISGDGKGGLIDDWRIRATLPTIRKLMKRGARVGILSHRGRPQGRVVPELSNRPACEVLSRMLQTTVDFVPDCVGRMAEQEMERLAPGKVLMFENTRFHLGDQLNQLPFVQRLMGLGEIFVNDAFAAAHRVHASTSGLAAAMPVSVIGDLMVQELLWLKRATENPARPLLLLIGGVEVAPRLELIARVLTRVDTLMLGGGVGLTFLAGRDLKLGQSQVEHSCVEIARELLAEAGVVGCRLHLPRDVAAARKQHPETPIGTREVHEIGEDEVANDIGPETLKIWTRLMEEAKTVIWIGSLGAFEHPAFRKGALTLAEILARRECFSLVAGNGLIQGLRDGGLRERLPAVSTGVGALLNALMGQSLPALSMLHKRGQEGTWSGKERRGQSAPTAQS